MEPSGARDPGSRDLDSDAPGFGDCSRLAEGLKASGSRLTGQASGSRLRAQDSGRPRGPAAHSHKPAHADVDSHASRGAQGSERRTAHGLRLRVLGSRRAHGSRLTAQGAHGVQPRVRTNKDHTDAHSHASRRAQRPSGVRLMAVGSAQGAALKAHGSGLHAQGSGRARSGFAASCLVLRRPARNRPICTACS
jgi:hypothetical protein